MSCFQFMKSKQAAYKAELQLQGYYKQVNIQRKNANGLMLKRYKCAVCVAFDHQRSIFENKKGVCICMCISFHINSTIKHTDNKTHTNNHSTSTPQDQMERQTLKLEQCTWWDDLILTSYTYAT